MAIQDPQEGTWLEAIGLFQQARAGDPLAGMRLLETSADPARVVHSFLRMLTVFLRGEDADKINHFLDASFRAGPPPLRPPEVDQVLTDIAGFEMKLRGRVTLTEPMLDMLATQVPILVTATRSGIPEVAPKPSLRVWNHHTLIYSEDASSQHLADICLDSKAAVAVIDPATLEGYRFIGTPEVHGSGEEFDAADAFSREKGLDQPAAVVLIRIEHIHTLTPGPATGVPTV